MVLEYLSILLGPCDYIANKLRLFPLKIIVFADCLHVIGNV
jgi:hypothetical protein